MSGVNSANLWQWECGECGNGSLPMDHDLADAQWDAHWNANHRDQEDEDA